MSDFDEKENDCEQFDFYHTVMVDEGDLPEIGEVKKELMDEHFTSDFEEKETSCEQIDLYHTEMVDEKDSPEVGEVKNEYIWDISEDNASDTGNGNGANADINLE